MERGLYIHIPFCKDICSYCDFCKIIYDEKLCDEYLEAVDNQLKEDVKEEITSIYVGGGTPSSLSLPQMEKLLEIISPYYKEGVSYTFEANVDSLDEEKIILLKKYHVNRVSLGVQSFKDSVLKDMRRHHNEEDTKRIISLLKKNGINDINIDLIYGYPFQNLEDVREDIKKALMLPITHISAYALTVQDNTFLKTRGLSAQNEDLLADEYDLIRKTLNENGFFRYEVSNFAKKGYESEHNLVYWNNHEYYGIGAGASGYIDKIRYDITRSVPLYIKGKKRIYEETISKKDEEEYFLILGLRKEKGISLEEYRNSFSDVIFKVHPSLQTLINEGSIEEDNGYLKVNENKIYILDFILERLLF